MLTRKFFLLVALVVAYGTLFAVTEVRAFPAGVPVTEPGPFDCSTAHFKITAVLGNDGEFPVAVSCTSSSNTAKQCAKYAYDIGPAPNLPLSQQQNIDHADVVISRDQNLDSTSPPISPTVVSPPCQGDTTSDFLINACHEYAVKFNANSSKNSHVEAVIVAPSIARISTVLVSYGSKNESCLIAGPGNPVFDPSQAVTQSRIEQAGPCIVSFSVAPNGKVIKGSLEVQPGGPTCTIQETDTLLIDGQSVLFTGPVQFTQPGSCQYCYTNTSGGKSCVTCTTCKVVNNVCTY